MKRAVGRGLCAAAFLGIALSVAAPDAAAHSSGHVHNRLYPVHHLDNPRIITSPASGDTYLPGETITVYIPWGRTVSGRCIQIHSVGTVELEMTVGGVTRTLTGRYENRRNRYGSGFDGTWLYFDYVVRKGDRDTDGVSLAEDALSSPGASGSSIRGTVCGGFSTIELSKQLHGFSNQSGHKVDTPAPTFSGVLAPAVVFYEGASVNYRLPAVANAADVHNLTYSVTSARPLPTGYTLNTSTATIAGSHGSASARQNYTLRATDGFNRTADLIFTLEVSTGAGIESISITSNPGADKTYGKVAPFGTNDTITVRVDFTHRLTFVRSSVCLNIRIGSNRQVCNPSYSTSDSSRWDKLDFSYAVQAGDWDGDGISFPTNPMGAGKDGGLRFRLFGGGDNRVNRNFGPTQDDPNHKVRGEQTTPNFGSTASPVYSWVKGNAVSQALPAVPAATDGDGGVTYAIEGSLPAGLSFAAATRTISGTPTAAQGATDYTLAATDGDGDRATLRFSIEIEEIAVSISSPSVAEGATGATATLKYAVTLNRVPGRQVTVAYAAASNPGTATSGTDYTAITGGTLTFTAAATSTTFDVTVTGDALDERNETVRIALSNPSGAVLGSASTGVGTITDDDPTPTLALALSDPDPGNPDTINESGTGNATTVTASLSGGTSGEAITVTVTATGGTAAAGDFSLSSDKTLTIAAGATTSSGTVTVTAVDDATDEPAETATVGGTVAGGHGLVAAPSGVTLTIADDDARPRSALALSPASISESGGLATVTATLSNPSAAAVTVTVSAAPVAPAVTTDFSLSSTTTLTIAASATSSTGTVTVTAVGNADDAPDKSVTVSGSASGPLGLGAADPPDATLTIRDDDGTPTVSLVLSSSSVSEDGGVATVTAELNGGTSSEAVTVTVDAVPGPGAVAADFSLSTAKTLTIAAGATTSTGAVTITANDNAVDSPDKSVTVSGTATGGNGIAAPASLTLTLTDDEATRTTRLALSSASIAEAGGVSTVTATLSGVSSATTTITVSASPGAGTDFTLTGTTLTIAAGSTTSTGTVTVTAVPDTTDSADKRVTVSGAATGGNGAESPPAATLTIVDDDALPTLSLSLSPTSIGEAGGVSTVTAALSHPSSAAVTLTVDAAAGTGAVATDFSLSTAKTLTIAAGATTSTGTVTVTAADNDVDAANKSVTVSATATGGNGVAAPSSVTLTLTDDETAGVTFNPATLTVTEQGASQPFTVVLDSEPTGGMNGTTWVGLTPSDTDELDLNMASSYPYNLSFNTSNWDTPQTVAVTALGDGDRADDAKQIRYTVAGYAGGEVTNQLAVTVTVIDDDKPAVSLSLSPSSISENGGVATVTATLEAASPATTTIMVTAATGTNAVAGDFALSSANTLTIAAGETTSTGTVTIAAVNNAVDEPDKSVTVSGSASNSDGVKQPADRTLAITDDDPAPTLSIDSPSVSEGNSGSRNLTFTATLSAASGREVTVDYADAGTGTATSGTDYTAIAAGTLTFATGTTSQTFDVSVTGDVLDEADETVKVRLKDPTNAAVSTTAGTGTGTITDDDATPTLSISEPSVAEGDSGSAALTYTVTLSAASGRQVTVRYADAGTGTATSGTDYAAITGGTLTFVAGTTSRTFSVSVTGDTVNEPNETVAVNWSNATNATITSRSGVVAAALRVDGTITDDDGAPTSITLTVDDDDVGEGDSATTITVTATVDGTTRFADAKTVTVSVAGSGTTGAVDFAAVSNFNISIAAGAASGAGTFTLTPTDDSDDETDETITVSGTSTGLMVTPATISLTDDDGTPTSITLAVNDDSVGEGDGATTITVTATLDGSTTLGSATTVRVHVVGSGTATAVDFDTVPAFDITIAAGDASGTADFTLTPTNDAVDETDETITVRGTWTGLTVNSATISLTDDDAAPTSIALTVDDSSVGEGDGATSITVTATVDGTTRFAEAKTVRVSVAGSGTATAVDFAAVEAFDIEIAAGAASSTASFTLTPTDDAVDEADETVTVSGESTSLTVNSATIALTDDDAAPTSITLTVDDGSVGEGDGAATITVTATVDGTTRFAMSTTVSVSVAGSGTATAVDFAAVSDFDITIPAGAASSTASFTLTPTDDAVDETDETVTVDGTSGSLTVNSATIALTDDDAAPTSITLTVSDDSVSEGDGATTITVTATVDGTTRFATSTTVEVLVRGTSGTATAVDFAAVSIFEIVIAAGAASGAGDFTLTPTNDVLDETDETITVYGASDDLTVNPATIALTDDDATPTAITLTVDDDSVAEDDGATTITVTATVDGGTRFVALTTVTVSVAGSGTAGAVDFAAVSDFDIEIDARDASGTGTFTLTPTNDVFDETNETITVSGTSGGLTVNAATITLTDDDAAPTAITLTVDDNSVAEDDGATTITVTAAVDGPTRFGAARTVTVSVAGSGTATAVDFTPVLDFDIEIATGAASATGTFMLIPADDAVDETDETVTVSGSSGSLTVNSATITLTDDDATPSITLTVDDNSVAEDDGATTITVTATVDGTTRFAAATTVTVSVGGSGTATAVDFASVSDFDITIAAEAASANNTFTLTPTNDVVDETNETVTVSGSSGSLTVNSDTINLTDDDAAPTAITLTVDDDGVAEDDGATTITVTATVDGTTRFATDTTVTVSVAGSGTPTAVDFASVSDFDIQIPAGAAGANYTFTLTPTNDVVDETDETVTVSGMSGSLTVNSATISLTDDDGVPTSITLTVDDDDVGEGDGAATITVTASANGATGFTQPQTVRVSVAGSGTVAAVDFASVPAFDIMLPAGALSASGAFTLTPTDDTEDEADETITVSGVSGSLPVNSATISLTDDDGVPTSLTLTVDDDTVSEGDGPTTIRVTATLNGTGRFGEAKTVRVRVSGSGTATAVDFASVPEFDITINASAASGTGTFTLTPTDDVVDETNETIKVRGTASGLRVNSDTITLADDDATPTAISLTVNDNSVGEGDGATTITVTATVDGATRFAEATTVTVSVAGSGSATAVDLAAVANFDITLAAEAASGTETFTLTPTDDVVDETNETVTVSGTSGSLTVNSATISLTDNDAAPTSITLTVNDNSIGEGDGATTITVTATVDGATRFAAATTVTVSVAGSGTATAVDFAAVTDFDIEIAAEAASASETFTLTPTDDAVDETNETVTVGGTSGSLTVNAATISLTDNDAAPTSITLTVNDNSVGEGDGATIITVTAAVDGTTRFAAVTTVRVSVMGTSTTAVDFTAVSDFDIQIAAGMASGSNTFTLTPTDDAVDEMDQTVMVSGTSGSLTVNAATISVTDNDAAPTSITLTVNDNSVAEDDGATIVTVTATVDGATRFAEATTVTVSVAGSGTATAVDFAAVANFDITIAAGAASANNTFTLTPTNDSVDETDETVTVSGTSGSLTVNSATISLTDNDAAPTSITLTVNDNSVGEGDGATTITVTATVDGTTRFVESTTVTVSVAGSGTATAVDFATVSDFDISIAAEAANNTENFTLTPTDDTLDETDETVTVSGTSGSLTVNSATITLADDDATPSLSIDSPIVAEGNAGANDMTFTVTLSAASGQQVTVNYAVDSTDPGTATSGTDYAPVSAGTLTFAVGTTSETVTVSVTGDTAMEPDETVRLTLSGATNATLGAATGVGTIVNEDGASLIAIDADPTTANVIEPGPLALQELLTDSANSRSYSVRLKTPPTQDVTVTVASGDTDAVTVGDTDGVMPGVQNTLTFTGLNWSTARTVTLTAAQDDDGVDESVTVTHAASTASDSEYTGDSASLTATVDDDETPAVVLDANPSTANVVDAGPVMLVEGHATDVAKTYSVRLATEPTQTVTVTLTSGDTGAVSIDDTDGDNTNGVQNTLVFASTTWDTVQNVTARAADDDDAADESVVLFATSTTATASEYSGLSARLTATVDDNETRGVVLSTSTLSVQENGSATYTVQLSSQPVGGNVTVTITGAGGGIAPSPTSLTFTGANWNTPRQVRVNAARDTNSANETATLTHTPSGAGTDYVGAATAQLVVTATDISIPGLQVSPTQLAVDENQSAEYTVRLNTDPLGSVTVTATSNDAAVALDADSTPQTRTLTFDSSNWDTVQTVTASAVEDDNGTDESATLTHAASGAAAYTGLTGGALPSVQVAVDDNDTRGLLIDTNPSTPNDIDAGPLAVDENSSKEYTVRLATQPTGMVTVTATSPEATLAVDSDASPQTRSLTFTTSTWATAQTVTARALDDDDSTGETLAVAHAATGGDYGGVSADLSVAVADDDEGVTITPTPAALTETNLDGATLALSLVNTAFSASASAAGVGAFELVGTIPNLSIAQVSGVTAGGTTATLTLAFPRPPGDFRGLPTLAVRVPASSHQGLDALLSNAAVVTAEVGVTVSRTSLALHENPGATNANRGTYTIVPDTPPTGCAAGIVVAVSGDNADVTANPALLTFTTSTWNTAQTVTATAGPDNDGVDDAATLSHAIATACDGAGYTTALAVAGVDVAVDDGHTPALVLDADPSTVGVEAGPLALVEGHATDAARAFSVNLATEPTQTVTVALGSLDAGAATIDGSPLVFDSSNWLTAQTVTARAADDADAADESVALFATSTTATASEYTGLSARLTATVDDNETHGVVLSTSTLAVQEGSSATYTARLSARPVGGNVTVAITGAGDGISASPTALTFTGTNWNAAQQVRVSAASDANGLSESVTLTHTPSGADYGGAAPAQLVATATDGNPPSLLVAPTALTLTEGGSGVYTVRLNAQPADPVTVTVGGATAAVSADTDAAAGVQTTLTFSNSTWSALRTVTVSAPPDDDATNATTTLTHAVAGTGGYANLAPAARPGVAVTVNDPDTQGILIDADPSTPNDIDAGPLAVTENQSAQYAVRLATQPTGTVTVTATSPDPTLAVDSDASPLERTLTFTTNTWNTAQTVTARALDDDDSGNETTAIAHEADGADYDDVSANLAATTVDDDAPALLLATSTLAASGVAEGGTQTYTVRLATEPSGTVTVAATATATATARVEVDMDGGQAGAQSSLRFDATNWNAPRTATVRGLPDDDAADGTATLRHSASGADYGGVEAADETFAVTDDDMPAVLLGATAVTVNEGSTAAYTVRLATRPVGGAVTVAATSANASTATVQPAQLRFGAGDWDVPKTFRVHGAQAGSATISHSASGADYGGAATTTVAATVRGTQAAGVRIEPPTLTLREGESGAYRVRLNTDPGGTVTVTATSGSAELAVDADATPRTKQLTFTTENWDREQTVTATALADDGVDDETATVTHAVTGYAGVATAPDLVVAVRDDDAPGLLFEPAEGLRLEESGAAGTYTARLRFAPSTPVAVAVSSDDAGVAVDTDGGTPLDQDTLAFNATNWATAQTVTVRAVPDADAASETATLLHAASGAGSGYEGVTATYAVRVSDADAVPAPTGVSASAAGPTSLAVRWTPSAGAEGHAVQWRRAGQAWSTSRQLTLPAGASSARIDGLATGVEYEVRVLGLNRGDPGDPSSSARATPRALGPGNRAPVAVAGFADRTLILGAAQALDLSGVFWDPDGDALSYAALSLNPSAVEASVSGSELRLRASGVGLATIYMYATDPGGLTGSQTLRARVARSAALSADDAQAPEGGAARLSVRLSPARSTSTRIVWSLVPAAAAATADAADLVETSGEATIPAGETRIEIAVAIADDDEIEPAREWFEVSLSAPDGCCGPAARARVTVREGVCDRTPAVRDALRGSASCDAPTPAMLAAVERLELSGAGAGSLRAGDFAGLSGLRTLLLDGNGLRTLPDGLFAGLDSLGELSLQGNPGAPFALAVELARTDADAWAPGPATVRARFALGAPFALRSELSAQPTAAGLPETVEIDAGATFGAPFAVASTSTLRLVAGPAPLPTARCGEAPCFRGVEAAPGEALTLYRRPPRAQPAPTPEPLRDGDDLRLALGSLIRLGDGDPDDLRWRASSSDESVATARVVGGSLVVTPAPGGEGAARIVLEVVDGETGLSATLRFDVQVEFHWPVRQASGWRAGALMEAARAASAPAPR